MYKVGKSRQKYGKMMSKVKFWRHMLYKAVKESKGGGNENREKILFLFNDSEYVNVHITQGRKLLFYRRICILMDHIMYSED